MLSLELKRLEAIGHQLVSALDHESNLSIEFGKHPDDLELYSRWVKARRNVERTREDYDRAMEACRKQSEESAVKAASLEGAITPSS